MSECKIVYMHIGQPKTGTSALQLFFADNHNALIKKGILCPKKGRIGKAAGANHFRLYFGHIGPGHPICPRDIGSSSKEWATVLKEIEKAPQRRVLLSCEAFSLFNRDQLKEIKSYLSKHEVKIVCYVRRIDNLVSSWSQHAVKMEGLGRLNLNNFMPVKDILWMYEDVFGRENIIIRPYEKRQLFKESIFFDFLYHIFGIEDTEAFKLPDRDANPNPHLSRDALEFKMLVNRLNIDAKHKLKILKGIHKFSGRQDKSSRKAFQDHNHLSPLERIEMIRGNMENDKRIATLFLGRKDGRLFYDPLPDPDSEWEPYTGLTPETALDISQEIIQDLFPAAEKELVQQNVTVAAVEQLSRDFAVLSESGYDEFENYLDINRDELLNHVRKILEKDSKDAILRDKRLTRLIIEATMTMVCNGALPVKKIKKRVSHEPPELHHDKRKVTNRLFLFMTQICTKYFSRLKK